MDFSFESNGKNYELHLGITEDKKNIEATLNGSPISWDNQSPDLDGPRFYTISPEEKLRIQYYRGKWYVTLNDKPLKKSATVFKTRLKRLSEFIYIIAILQLILGLVAVFLDSKPETITIAIVGLVILALAYQTSQAKRTPLLILIGIIIFDLIFTCKTMYDYYNIAYSQPSIPFFVPCMRVLIEIYYLIILVPGIKIVQGVRKEMEAEKLH